MSSGAGGSLQDRTLNKVALCSAVFAGFAYVGYSYAKTAFCRKLARRHDLCECVEGGEAGCVCGGRACLLNMGLPYLSYLWRSVGGVGAGVWGRAWAWQGMFCPVGGGWCMCVLHQLARGPWLSRVTHAEGVNVRQSAKCQPIPDSGALNAAKCHVTEQSTCYQLLV